METIYADGTPIAAYLEGKSPGPPLDARLTIITGTGEFEPVQDALCDTPVQQTLSPSDFAPPNISIAAVKPKNHAASLPTRPRRRRQTLQRIHDQWSTAINSRLGRSKNANFLEHFRYILVASQLLNEYPDQGTFASSDIHAANLDGADSETSIVDVATSPAGVVAVAAGAFVCALLLHWIRISGLISKKRAAAVLALYTFLAIGGYVYLRKHWLKYLRQQAVEAATKLTGVWQSFESSISTSISLIQEVELVSKGYRLSTPLPPISRVEDSSALKRCAKLRKTLHQAFAAIIPACIDANTLLRSFADDDDLERYYEIYDINMQDVKEASGLDALGVIDDDAESLKSLRVLSFKAGVLRRVVLCHLMALPADGGQPDNKRWRQATEAMSMLAQVIATWTTKITHVLHDMENLTVPATPTHKTSHTPTREKMRSQVRKIATLSTGIRSLQAKMQILREETNRSIEQSEDVADLGADLMVQYDSIGADLKELMQAWELGKASLQSNISKKERRISLASSGLRSPVSSLGGLTAVDEDGTPADALRALTGEANGVKSDTNSHRSSMITSSSEDEVFEAVGIPRQRSSLTREERIIKMQEERDRQAQVRAKRDANTSMLKELESVINLRPKTATTGQRVTSM